ncbi:MAG TPA: hypothetical protein PKJ62_01920 [Bacteroidia bacterium]|nr:hypothetical protein [Bacteroidia bacterium]HNS12452.1 hypothetical protein [Bacteroidia bacterium]
MTLAQVGVDTRGPDSSKVRIASITLIGNKLTKDHIIYRELTFRVSDTIESTELDVIFQRSEENLMNTSLFHSARITRLHNADQLDVYIIFSERWYIFPLPILEIAERNFNVWWQTKDFSRLVYGGVLTWNNFRGRNEEVGATIRLGYTQRISFYYKIPFINKKQKSGLNFGFAYSRNHQTAVRTRFNQVEYFKDEEKYARTETGASISYSHRADLYESHLIEASYRYAQVLDTVLTLNPEYFSDSKSSTKYFSLRYLFKSDHRDLVAYPLKGRYIDIELLKTGLPFLKDDVNIYALTTRLKKFWDISNGFYVSAGLTARITGTQNQPYYNSKALGYGTDYLRGYEYYVIDGQSFALFKTNIKYKLLGERVLDASFIPLNKFNVIPFSFYLNLYSDAGYVNDSQFSLQNDLTNDWQFSGGLGLDFVTYYDLVFRFEYSRNKLGESGFFLHFTAPI